MCCFCQRPSSLRSGTPENEISAMYWLPTWIFQFNTKVFCTFSVPPLTDPFCCYAATTSRIVGGAFWSFDCHPHIIQTSCFQHQRSHLFYYGMFVFHGFLLCIVKYSPCEKYVFNLTCHYKKWVQFVEKRHFWKLACIFCVSKNVWKNLEGPKPQTCGVTPSFLHICSTQSQLRKLFLKYL